MVIAELSLKRSTRQVRITELKAGLNILCNLLFGEIAVSAFGIWGAMRPQNAQQHKRSWILTLLLGILWLSVGVFGLMS